MKGHQDVVCDSMWGLREEKKERKDQNVELRRLQNRCFIHSIDLFCVYLTFAKMPIERDSW